MPVTGGCLCGAVRWRSAAPPFAARACQCRDCQYFGGGGGIANAGFATDTLTVTGDVTWYESVADSGNVMRRGFCPACGTPLFSGAVVRPHQMFVRIGSFDDMEVIAPQMTIWTASAPSWVTIDPSLPMVEGQPAPPPAA
ncbi:GFA family protein [Sphingomonas naphthae]|uniref:GFA family protein n=2 Tax=Sphingomonas naphthae TaxID=1813468 RepID=A0ABY7TQ63_9SPHN|nr:GFA family protein [Sphingomonas naphthae]WCT75378.1 GFA family protein [Sphingomonas naphthae]